jgi:hypothetical protein
MLFIILTIAYYIMLFKNKQFSCMGKNLNFILVLFISGSFSGLLCSIYTLSSIANNVNYILSILIGATYYILFTIILFTALFAEKKGKTK